MIKGGKVQENAQGEESTGNGGSESLTVKIRDVRVGIELAPRRTFHGID